MKSHKEITWDDIKAMNAETSKLLDRIGKRFEQMQQVWEEERQKREDEERIKQQKREEEEKEEKIKQQKREDEERIKQQKREEEERIKQQKREEEERIKQQKREEEEKEEKIKKQKWEEEEKIKQQKREEEHRNFMKRMDRLDQIADRNMEQIGGISKSNGEFCEEYFINSFKENPTLLGEKFDRVMPNLYPDPMVINDEYDLVLRNGTTAALIEMKYKANAADVGKMFHKLQTYRANYPMFKDYKIYLCLASFRFPKYVREKAAKEGIVLIEQRGEKIEVISENVRAW